MILINPGAPSVRGQPPLKQLPMGANLRGIRTDEILISLDELIDYIREQQDGPAVLNYIVNNLGPTLRPKK